MPSYNYKCVNLSCENSNGFKIEASIRDKPLRICPKCSHEVNRVFLAANVNLCFNGSYNSTREK